MIQVQPGPKANEQEWGSLGIKLIQVKIYLLTVNQFSRTVHTCCDRESLLSFDVDSTW